MTIPRVSFSLQLAYLPTTPHSKAMIQENLHRLPEEVLRELVSDNFAAASDAKFRECDADANGVLPPTFPHTLSTDRGP